jgi:hypothetical protein
MTNESEGEEYEETSGPSVINRWVQDEAQISKSETNANHQSTKAIDLEDSVAATQSNMRQLTADRALEKTPPNPPSLLRNPYMGCSTAG